MRTIPLFLAAVACSPVEPSDSTALDGPLPPPVACAPGEVARIGPQPYATAQQAVDDAVAGDVVTLCRGTHLGGLDVNTYASITVAGETGDPADVLLDASSTGWGVRHYGQFGRITFSGFTVINADGDNAIDITREELRLSGVVVRDSALSRNVMELFFHTALLEDTTIEKSTANVMAQFWTLPISGSRARLTLLGFTARQNEVNEGFFFNRVGPPTTPRADLIIQESAWVDNVALLHNVVLGTAGELRRVVIVDSVFERNMSTGGSIIDVRSFETTTSIRGSTFTDNSSEQGVLSAPWRGTQIEDSVFYRNLLPTQPPGADNGAVIHNAGPLRLRNVDFGLGADTNFPRDISNCPDYGVVAQFQLLGSGCPP